MMMCHHWRNNEKKNSIVAIRSTHPCGVFDLMDGCIHIIYGIFSFSHLPCGVLGAFWNSEFIYGLFSIHIFPVGRKLKRYNYIVIIDFLPKPVIIS